MFYAITIYLSFELNTTSLSKTYKSLYTLTPKSKRERESERARKRYTFTQTEGMQLSVSVAPSESLEHVLAHKFSEEWQGGRFSHVLFGRRAGEVVRSVCNARNPRKLIHSTGSATTSSSPGSRCRRRQQTCKDVTPPRTMQFRLTTPGHILAALRVHSLHSQRGVLLECRCETSTPVIQFNCALLSRNHQLASSHRTSPVAALQPKSSRACIIVRRLSFIALMVLVVSSRLVSSRNTSGLVCAQMRQHSHIIFQPPWREMSA